MALPATVSSGGATLAPVLALLALVVLAIGLLALGVIVLLRRRSLRGKPARRGDHAGPDAWVEAGRRMTDGR